MPKTCEKLSSQSPSKNKKVNIHKKIKKDRKRLFGVVGIIVLGIFLILLIGYSCMFGTDILGLATIFIASYALFWQITAMLSTQRISPKLNLTLHIDDEDRKSVV